MSQLRKVAENTALNCRLIRNAYRWGKDRRQLRTLFYSVDNIPSMSKDSYLEYQPKIFASHEIQHLTPDERSIVSSKSIKTYFSVNFKSDNTCEISDTVLNSNYFSRQRMLATVYHLIGEENITKWDMCDLGGSNGYYSFHAASLGFKSIDVVDPRPEHECEYKFIRNRLGGAKTVNFIRGDIHHPELKPEYDVMLVQGLLYHIYDHFSFLQKLHRLTRRYLILESELSGSHGFWNLVRFEDVANLRSGIDGPAVRPAYGTVIGLLRTVGFQHILRIEHPKDVMDLHGYGKGRRIMLLCKK